MRRSTVAILVVLGTAATTSVAVGQQGGPAGVVTAASGSVTLTRANAVQPLRFRSGVEWRDIIETQAAAHARLLLLGRTSLTVRELSRLQLTTDVVRLNSGKLRAVIEPSLMRPGDRFEVETPNAIAAVRGTDLVVDLESLSESVVQSAIQSAIYALNGLVLVRNPLSATQRVEQIGPFEGVRVSGIGDPARFRFTAADLPRILKGVNIPPKSPPPATATAQLEQSAAGEAGSLTPRAEFPRSEAPPRTGQDTQYNNTSTTINKTSTTTTTSGGGGCSQGACKADQVR